MMDGASTTDDFASAALVGLVRAALADAGLPVPPLGAQAAAVMPLAAKRDLLAAVARDHGLAPLLAAGRRLPLLPSDPAVRALLAAADPADLFARWSRLERFVHSRHRVAVREVGERHLVAEHLSTADEPPRAFEDALILGTMAAALSAIGAVRVTARFGADAGAPIAIAEGALREPEEGAPTCLWRFEWADLLPPPRTPVVSAPSGAEAALRQLVTADPARGWTVAAAGTTINMSPRSLQRALKPAGGFAAVVGAVRAECAADYLMNRAHPLSLVGFACGYADQPHFTREFKRRTGVTPAAYRHSFAAGRSIA